MGTRLFIGNLSYNVNEQELRDAFTNEGIEVRSVRVALDRETGRPRGFAFVETATDEGAKASIEKLSGRLLQGRPIIVEEAQARVGGPGGGAGAPRPPSSGPRPGGYQGPASGTGGGGFAPRPPGAGGFGGPRPPGPGGGGFGAPRPPGAGGFGGPPRPFGGPPRPPGSGPGGPALGAPRTDAPPRRERPEKKKSTRPKAEEQERGNWRWNGKVDDD